MHSPFEDDVGVRNSDNARSHGTAAVSAPSLPEMFEASLLGFWTLAARLNLSVKEQAALLAVSESTCRRWRRETPRFNANALDRLQLVLRTYAALSARGRKEARCFLRDTAWHVAAMARTRAAG